MKIVPLLFLIATQIFGTDAKTQLKNPWEYLSPIAEGEYLLPISELKSQEQNYLSSTFRNLYVQSLATVLSYVGRYDDAQKYFDLMVSSGNQLPVPEDLTQFHEVEAVPAILGASYNKQVVMLNEAHHVPETRALTFALLKPLYDQGFRYLAMETFTVDGIKKAEVLGFPVRGIGYYSSEPLMADIAREAMKIGYKLVAYEHTDPCDYEHFPKECQDKRERGQAQNLVDRIFKIDSEGRVLVHAGYGHIDETGGSSTFPWVPMAKYFKDISSIDPFTVDQVECRSRSNLAVEASGYRRLVKHFKVTRPTLLRTLNHSLWTALPGHYDAQVILPASTQDNSFPGWAQLLTGRRQVRPRWKYCKSFPCLVQAVLVDEAKTEYLPLSQVYAESKKQAKDSLTLRPGKYIVRYVSSKGSEDFNILVNTMEPTPWRSFTS